MVILEDVNSVVHVRSDRSSYVKNEESLAHFHTYTHKSLCKVGVPDGQWSVQTWLGWHTHTRNSINLAFLSL